MEELHLNVVTTGRAIESEDFWRGLNVEKFTGDFEEIALVVYPAYIEHQPRHILKAVSHGIPVITTTACGIDSSEQIKVVPSGNFERLKHEVYQHLDQHL